MGARLSLHDACSSTDVHAVKQLLHRCTEAELEQKDSNGRTPLLLAVAALKRNPEEEEEDDLYDEVFGGIDQDDDEEEESVEGEEEEEEIGDEHKSISIGPVLHMSRRGSQTDTLPNLQLPEEADEGNTEIPSPEQAETDLVEAQNDDLRTGQEDEGLQHRKAPADPGNGTIPMPPPPPIHAPQSRKQTRAIEIVRLLLNKRVNLDHHDEHGWTALHYACFVQSTLAIHILLEAGAQPTRDNVGLLPQDLLRRSQHVQNEEQLDQMKALLDKLTDTSSYRIKLLTLRPSGIVQIDLGAQVEQGSLLTVEYEVPENHSPKDYIQMLITKENNREVQMGKHYYVPKGGKGRIVVNTDDIGASTWVRFVYVKCDINSISRCVVASGCNAMIESSVGEIFQYELYLYQRVVEVETIPEFDFVDQPLLILKRIGIARSDVEEIDWVNVRPENHIVAVNDIPIDHLDFDQAVRILQENNGKECTKLLMQNYAACGDFIPEKVLGVGVIGKYASLHPISGPAEEDQVSHSKMNDWIAPEPTEQVSSTAHVSSTLATSDTSKSASSSMTNDPDTSSAVHESPEDSSPRANEQVMPLHFNPQLVQQLQLSFAH